MGLVVGPEDGGGGLVIDGRLADDGPPAMVCLRVRGGMEDVRVIDVGWCAGEVCLSARTSLSDIFGPEAGPCHGDRGAAVAEGVRGLGVDGEPADCSACCCCCCCLLRSRCVNLPGDADTVMSSLVVLAMPSDMFEGRVDAVCAMISFMPNFDDDKEGDPHGLPLVEDGVPTAADP